jgi:hypothetical protein
MPPTREEAVATLGEGQAGLGALLDQLSEKELTAPATIGGGDWSAKDLIVHIRAWEAFALDAVREWRRGERPMIEDTFAGPTKVDELNAMVFEQQRDRSLDDVRREAELTHRSLVDEIERMSDEEWMAKAPYPTDKRRRLCELVGSVLGAPQRPFGHAFAHLPDLQAYVKGRE